MQLSRDFSLDEDDLGNTIVAFALNSKKKILDIELLTLLESVGLFLFAFSKLFRN